MPAHEPTAECRVERPNAGWGKSPIVARLDLRLRRRQGSIELAFAKKTEEMVSSGSGGGHGGTYFR
jgi:hypothetical protein